MGVGGLGGGRSENGEGHVEALQEAVEGRCGACRGSGGHALIARGEEAGVGRSMLCRLVGEFWFQTHQHSTALYDDQGRQAGMSSSRPSCRMCVCNVAVRVLLRSHSSDRRRRR